MNPRCLCLLVLLLAAIAVPGAARVTVLPLGDSITRGDSDAGSVDGSYRYYLYEQLAAAGYDVDFVGSITVPDFTRFVFDQEHDGHSGNTTGSLLFDDKTKTEPLKEWLAAYAPPDYVLLMIGTNDAVRQVPLEERLANLRQVFGVLRARSPGVTILLAQIIPTADSYRNTMQIVPFNNRLPEIAAECSTPSSPIVVVDQYSGYAGVADNRADGIHPARSGMQKIAARWYGALAPVLPAPGPTVTVPPIILPTPTPGISVPGGTGPARDLDGDGRPEDINGNGRADFADVVLFFNQMSWCAANAPSGFDFNANGRVDFGDVVRLFGSL